MNRIHWVLTLLGILAISTLFQMFTFSYFEKYNYEIIDYFVTPLASLITGILLFFLLVLPIFDKTSNLSNLQRILILGVLGIVYSIAFILILHLFPILFYENPSDFKKSVFGFFVAGFHNVLKNYLFQIAILFAFEYLSKETKFILLQKNMEVELNQTKLKLLKSRLQPHFLFNSMNSIVSEIDSEPRKAQEMLINLSDILRETLESDFQESVTLREELEILLKYLSIEKVRYEDQLIFEINIPEDEMRQKLPKMILQPLVENAIKYGFNQLNKSLHIIIEFDKSQNSVLVKNNGSPLPSQISMGTGLENVTERLKIFTGNEISFKIYQEGEWIINKLYLK